MTYIYIKIFAGQHIKTAIIFISHLFTLNIYYNLLLVLNHCSRHMFEQIVFTLFHIVDVPSAVRFNEKTLELYTRVFRMLLDLVPEWTPTNVMSDYEDAPINALHACPLRWQHPFNRVLVSLLSSHIQVTYRRVVRLGLPVAYREQEAVRTLCRSLMVLPME